MPLLQMDVIMRKLLDIKIRFVIMNKPWIYYYPPEIKVHKNNLNSGEVLVNLFRNTQRVKGVSIFRL